MAPESAKPKVIIADITTLQVDAIVNAANEQLAPGGGVCGAIFAAAGPDLARACNAIGGCPAGDVRITEGYDLPAKYVIHAVGPIYMGGDHGEARTLAACYRRSLEVAHDHDVESIAFPCISTGIFGYPLEEAAGIAIEAVRSWRRTEREPSQVICCCFSESDAAVYERILKT